MRRVKYFIQQSWLLIAASFVFGLLIAVTNAALSEKIEQNRIDKIDNLLGGLLPQAKSFQLDSQLELRAKGKTIKSNLYKALSASGEIVGWAFNCQGSGYSDKIELLVAVDKSFEKISGFACLASNETPGFGDKITTTYYQNQFEGAPTKKLELLKTGEPSVIDSQIIAITGATVSSQAVVDIINNAIEQVKECIQNKEMTSNAK